MEGTVVGRTGGTVRSAAGNQRIFATICRAGWYSPCVPQVYSQFRVDGSRPLDHGLWSWLVFRSERHSPEGGSFHPDGDGNPDDNRITCPWKSQIMSIFRRPLVRTVLTTVFLLFCGLALSCGQAGAEEQPPERGKANDFVRLRRSADGEPLSLQTSIVGYRGNGKANQGVRVDLIGAVHVGDKAYYETLNKAFSKYDVVLYELVAKANEVPQPGQRSANPVSALQMGMKSMLELEFQLDCIDYGAANMVHADFTPEEFSRSMKNRGESITQMFLRMMGQSIAQQSKDPSGSGDFRMLLAFLSKDRTARLKRIMAEQLSDLSAASSVLDGPDGSTILTERNKRAVEVLQRSLQEGHKSIGIFYGAAHLPDLEKRLTADLDLVRHEHRWLTAWSLRNAEEQAEPATEAP